MSKSDRHKLLQHPAIVILKKALKKEWRQQVLASFALGLAGLSLLYFFYPQYWILSGLGFLLSPIGFGLCLHKIRQGEGRHNQLMELLESKPEQIVWVYTVVTQRMPFGFALSNNGLLYFKLLDGDEICLSLPVTQLKLVSKTLNRLLPHATFGYDDNKAQWYLADPAMLIRDQNEESA